VRWFAVVLTLYATCGMTLVARRVWTGKIDVLSEEGERFLDHWGFVIIASLTIFGAYQLTAGLWYVSTIELLLLLINLLLLRTRISHMERTTTEWEEERACTSGGGFTSESTRRRE
jgi:hypothetical protein